MQRGKIVILYNEGLVERNGSDKLSYAATWQFIKQLWNSQILGIPLTGKEVEGLKNQLPGMTDQLL